jgi:hypothetical protein
MCDEYEPIVPGTTFAAMEFADEMNQQNYALSIAINVAMENASPEKIPMFARLIVAVSAETKNAPSMKVLLVRKIR